MASGTAIIAIDFLPDACGFIRIPVRQPVPQRDASKLASITADRNRDVPRIGSAGIFRITGGFRHCRCSKRFHEAGKAQKTLGPGAMPALHIDVPRVTRVGKTSADLLCQTFALGIVGEGIVAACDDDGGIG